MARSEMGKQPLWLDVSRWQGDLNFDKIKASDGYDEVYGIYSRAGWGEDGGYIDWKFNRNWSESKRIGVYRGSYWAYWGYFPLDHQLDLWYQANPTIDLIPRMWDFEVLDNSMEWLSNKTWEASEKVLERDGHRFIIYTRYDILEKTLCKYWTPQMLNEHYFMIAQYDISTPENPSESNGIVVPTNIEPDNILWKQTSSDFEIYDGSGRVDRDRWIWTSVDVMHNQIQEMWGNGEPVEPEPPVEPDPDCCEELKNKVTSLRTDLDSVENVSNDNHTRLGATRTELQDLESKVEDVESKNLQLERATGEQATQISNLQGELGECRLTIENVKAEFDLLEKKVDRLSTRLRIFELIKKLFNPSDGNDM